MVRCECGAPAYPVTDQLTGGTLRGYYCPVHGFLHHSAIIYETEEHMPSFKEEPKKKQTMHAVYVKETATGSWMINSSYQYKDDAFTKAKECYEAFDEVCVARVEVDLP